MLILKIHYLNIENGRMAVIFKGTTYYFTKNTTAKLIKQVLPKVIWEQRVALVQPCNKIHIGYNGMPQIHPQTAPSFSTITTPI